MKTTMAIDQYGTTYHDLGKYPRKALLDHFSAYRSHIRKMYVDDKSGEARHVGYKIGEFWLTLYTVTSWR